MKISSIAFPLSTVILTLSAAKWKDPRLHCHGLGWRKATCMTAVAFSWFRLNKLSMSDCSCISIISGATFLPKNTRPGATIKTIAQLAEGPLCKPIHSRLQTGFFGVKICPFGEPGWNPNRRIVAGDSA